MVGSLCTRPVRFEELVQQSAIIFFLWRACCVRVAVVRFFASKQGSEKSSY